VSHEQHPIDASGRNGAARIPSGTPITSGTPIPPPEDPGPAVNGGVRGGRLQPPTAGEPHDVLAAEEFAFPVGQPRAPGDADPRAKPHDVLAAEEFALPATHPRAPVDPQRRPHDVLAAEEFAFPAAAGLDPPPSGPVRASRPALLAAGVAGLVLLALGARRRRHHA